MHVRVTRLPGEMLVNIITHVVAPYTRKKQHKCILQVDDTDMCDGMSGGGKGGCDSKALLLLG